MNNFKRRFKYTFVRDESGFTLIETSVIMAVFSLLLTSFLLVMGSRIQQDRLEAHFNNVAEISERLKNYALVNGAYPLPANPLLDSTHADYGYPINSSDLPALTSAECDGTMKGPENIICTVGAQSSNTIANGDVVYMGAVPTSLLGYNSDESLDIHGSIYTYAVTGDLTNPATFSNDGGLIQVLSHETKTDAAQTDSDLHFIVISHGANQGTPFDPVTSFPVNCEESNGGVACNAAQQLTFDNNKRVLEEENGEAPADATFMILTKASPPTPGVANSSVPNFSIMHTILEIEGNNYFDDAASFEYDIYGREWTARGNDQINLTMKLEDTTEGTGNVLIGESNYTSFSGLGNHENYRPQMLIDGSVAATDAILSKRICTKDQRNCFETKDIVNEGFDADGNSMKCVARGLKDIAISGGTWQRKDGWDKGLQGTCEVITLVANDNTNLPDSHASPCIYGSHGFNANGEMICK